MSKHPNRAPIMPYSDDDFEKFRHVTGLILGILQREYPNARDRLVVMKHLQSLANHGRRQ